MTAPTVITSDKTNDSGSLLSLPKFFVPLRDNPTTPDPSRDPQRLQFGRGAWSKFDDLVRQQNRQIEENVRMLSGQQHSIYHPLLGKFLDVNEWMNPEERAWRARPVFNRLLPWFIITHARATENQPIVTFLPGPDRLDADLANILDIAMKTVWFDANMEDVHDRLMGWVIAAGRAHLMSRINPNKGPLRKWIGEAFVPVVDTNDQPIPDNDGGTLSQHIPEGVPFDKQGQPLAKYRMTAPGVGELVHTGKPHATHVGGIEVDVLSPMQVRGSWGPQPWHQKRRHLIRSYHPPEDVYDMFGVEVPPDVRGGSVTDTGELERLLFGTGFYGSNTSLADSQTAQVSTEGYVEVTQLWEAPCSYGGMEETDDSPGGRWLVCSRSQVIRDGPRPAKFPYTSPLNTFEFIRMPGRPGGTTVQEALNQVQRNYNDAHGRFREHVNLSTNPKTIIDQGSGIKAGKWTNRPGENHVVNRRPGVPAVEFVAPPQLGQDVYKWFAILGQEFHDIGFMAGANDPGTPGDSGEKVKEVRFNTDRFLGPTMRRTAGEYGRVFENWQALLPLIWDMETTISYAGDDNVAETITVYPELFREGKVNARADVESMLPEGRGEQQQKVFSMYNAGLFGLPGSPQALAKFWDMAHMPHLSRSAKPGGVDATTAEQENGQLMQGIPAASIPVYEWYDDDTHLLVLEKFMKGPKFKELAPNIRDQFVLHRQAHQFNKQTKAAKAAMQMTAMQNVLAVPSPPQAGAVPPQPPSPNGPNGPPVGGGPPVRPLPPAMPHAGVPGGAMPTNASAPSGSER